jgi:hypothetical protein
MFKLQPEPWKDPKVKVRVKTNAYFHEKHEIWNSLAHSSPKVSKFYLKPQKKPGNSSSLVPAESPSKPIMIIPQQCETLKRASSREQIKRRQLEREALQARSNQCITARNIPEVNPRFSTFKDPAAHPVICRAKTFDNYNELPENRLKLVINEFILEKDSEALKHMSKKIEEEVKHEEVVKDWHVKNRAESLARMKKQRKINKEREEMAGLDKIKQDSYRKQPSTSQRIQRLSVAKEVKVGFPVDYNESCGLLRAGVLSSEKAKFPKSAREPQIKKVSMNVLPEYSLSSSYQKPRIVEEYDQITLQEITDQMKELEKFEKRIGDKKDNLGFPHIDLEKFQKGNFNE